MIASRFERMVVIPEQEYNYLKSMQQVNNPLQKHFSSLSNEYTRQHSIADPYNRVQQQGETLNELLKIKEDIRNRVIQSTPKPYQTRAQNLLKHIESEVKVNEGGEVLDSSQSPLAGSNITDLIQHAVRDRRRNIQPVGWSYFKDRLKAMNVPQSLLNYETIDEMKQPLRIKSEPTYRLTESPVKRKRRVFATTIARKIAKADVLNRSVPQVKPETKARSSDRKTIKPKRLMNEQYF